MYFPNPEWLLKATRDQRNLEGEWEELRAWVQAHQHLFRMAGIAREAGMSGEIVTALLLRDVGSNRISRSWDRLDALLLVFMRPPFQYVPTGWQKMG